MKIERREVYQFSQNMPVQIPMAGVLDGLKEIRQKCDVRHVEQIWMRDSMIALMRLVVAI